MGRKAGIALSAIGLVFIILALGTAGSVFSALYNIPPGVGLGGFAIIVLLAYGLLLAAVFWILGIIFYLAAFLTSRGVTSKAIGSLFILGGLLHFIFIIIVVSTVLGGPAAPVMEALTLAILLVLPIIAGVSMIIAGIKRVR